MTFAQGVLTSAELARLVRDDVERLKRASDQWASEKPGYIGLPTGLANLDSLLGGLSFDEVTVLAGDPGGGKTALLAQLLERTAQHLTDEGDPRINLFFSAEMPKRTLLQRSASRIAQVEFRKIRLGEATPNERARWQQALEYLAQLPIVWIDTPGMTSQMILGAVEILANHEGLKFGVIGVDYIQQLYDEGQNDTQRIPVIMRNMTRVKMETEAAVVLLSQYSRRKTVEHRPPELEDLLGSGNIGRAADQVWMLHDPPVEEVFQGPGPRAVRKDMYVRKNRNGPQGVVSFFYRPSHTLFFSPAVTKPPLGSGVGTHQVTPLRPMAPVVPSRPEESA